MNSRVKRLIDIIVSAGALVIALPILAIIALATKMKMGSPVIFRQTRPGLSGMPFIMYKFRSMRDEYDRNGNLLSESERVTPFGIFLRTYSLDELPELINVLKGEMSLVGPRPLLMEYMDRYTPKQARRHEVKPGITGWAQVHGRNAVTWEEKFELDIWYVENWSVWLDIKILWRTLATVFNRDQVDTEGFIGMPEFMGSNNKNTS